ncbi:MAG TPA: isoprenylcysteine carboxylmethyltransferase family protein [Blastocatellia bacterium]|nr:isoprenylcysteine carboxylmethyltransferase family protein [Blastocatellia bacterium]
MGLRFRAVTGVISYVALFAIFLFLPAGTLHWRRAWALLGLLLAVRTIGVLRLIHTNGALLAERSKPPIQQGQPIVDRVLLISFMATYAGLIAFASLDRFRFHFIGPPVAAISIAGLVVFVAGWWIVTLALETNAFAARVVRLQSERCHAVVDAGVYGIVRHPMYAGVVLVMTGMCLWLQSYAALLAASIPAAILVLRIVTEERFLTRELEGYGAYRSRVSRRLIPGLW